MNYYWDLVILHDIVSSLTCIWGIQFSHQISSTLNVTFKVQGHQYFETFSEIKYFRHVAIKHTWSG